MKTILVTGFRAYGSEPRNPSGEVAGEFRGTERAGCRVEAAVLPVARAQILDTIANLLERYRPDAVIATGVALDRPEVSVERFAHNLEDYKTPDELGEQPRGESVIEGGAAELEATLPVEEIVREIRSAGVPVRMSRDAGAYLCNRLYYGLLHEAAGARPGRGFHSVFIHLPPAPGSVDESGEPRSCLSLELSREAVEAAIRVAARKVG